MKNLIIIVKYCKECGSTHHTRTHYISRKINKFCSRCGAKIDHARFKFKVIKGVLKIFKLKSHVEEEEVTPEKNLKNSD